MPTAELGQMARGHRVAWRLEIACWMVFGHRAVAYVRSPGDFQSIRGWVSGS